MKTTNLITEINAIAAKAEAETKIPQRRVANPEFRENKETPHMPEETGRITVDLEKWARDNKFPADVESEMREAAKAAGFSWVETGSGTGVFGPLKSYVLTRKITVDNLETASAQEVFDQTARHLLTQKQRSESELGCAYRGAENRQCAAGPLIPGKKYDYAMEGVGWRSLTERYGFPAHHSRLISELQSVHDFYEPHEWKECLGKLAESLDLSSAVLSEF